jgi:hypothetical protein
MKWSIINVVGLTLVLCGCATLNQGDRMILQQHNVSPALYDRMAHGVPLAVPDMIELTKKGLPASFIIHYLRSTEASYLLTSKDVSELKKGGVSLDVINYLLATPSIYGPRRYPYYPPPYYSSPYPPPYPYDPYYYGYPQAFISGPYHHWHHW